MKLRIAIEPEEDDALGASISQAVAGLKAAMALAKVMVGRRMATENWSAGRRVVVWREGDDIDQALHALVTALEGREP